MIPAFDILLPLGAAAFYLYDCAVPLYGNEVLLSCHRRKWTVLSPSHYVLLGRKIAMLPPLLPHQPAFQSAISAGHILLGRETDQVDDVQPFIAAMRGLGMITLILLSLLMLALPIASIVLGAGIVVLAIFAAYYLTLFTGLVLVFRRRLLLGVAGRAFVAFAFDVLLCPPFGVNMLRKLTLRRGLHGNAVAFAHRNFGRDELEKLRLSLLGWEIEAGRRRPLQDPDGIPDETPQMAVLRNPELWR